MRRLARVFINAWSWSPTGNGELHDTKSMIQLFQRTDEPRTEKSQITTKKKLMEMELSCWCARSCYLPMPPKSLFLHGMTRRGRLVAGCGTDQDDWCKNVFAGCCYGIDVRRAFCHSSLFPHTTHHSLFEETFDLARKNYHVAFVLALYSSQIQKFRKNRSIEGQWVVGLAMDSPACSRAVAHVRACFRLDVPVLVVALSVQRLCCYVSWGSLSSLWFKTQIPYYMPSFFLSKSFSERKI